MKTLVIILLIAVAAWAVWTYRAKIPSLKPEPVYDSGPIRVVRQRPGGAQRAPGAKLSEPEAVMTLRHGLAARVKSSECLAIASRGHDGDIYKFDAVDSCNRISLGRWEVDGRTGAVKQFPVHGGG